MRHCARGGLYGRRVVGDGLVVSLSSILIGLYVGLLRGGLVRNIGSARIQWWGMLVVGVAIPVLVNRTDPARGVALVVLSLIALIAFAIRNRALTGMSIVVVVMVGSDPSLALSSEHAARPAASNAPSRSAAARPLRAGLERDGLLRMVSGPASIGRRSRTTRRAPGGAR